MCPVNTPSNTRPDAGPILAHRLRRWPSIKPALVQRLVFAGICESGSVYCWQRVQADTDPMHVKCWAHVAGAGQYPTVSIQP